MANTKKPTPAAVTAPAKPMSVIAPVILKPGVKPNPDREYDFKVLELHFMLGTTPTDEIIDMFATANILKGAVDKWLKAAKVVLEGRETEKPTLEAPITITGGSFQYICTYSERVALDTERIKQDMGADWIAKYSSTTPVVTRRFKPISVGEASEPQNNTNNDGQ